MTLQEFITKYNGKGIDFDGWYGDQCVDLMNQYCVDVLGISSPISILGGETAFDIYTNYNGSQFQKIANTPTGVPQAGDIVFWDTTVGTAGHVDVFISGDANSFTGFDQNWPSGSLAHEQAHQNYNGVAGWLHPVPTTQMATISQADLDKLRKDRDTNYNNWQADEATVKSLNTQIATLQGQVSSLDSQVTSLTQSLSQAQTVAQQVPGLQSQLTQCQSDRTSCLVAQEGQNKKIATLQQMVDAKKPTKFIDKIKYLFS